MSYTVINKSRPCQKEFQLHAGGCREFNHARGHREEGEEWRGSRIIVAFWRTTRMTYHKREAVAEDPTHEPRVSGNYLGHRILAAPGHTEPPVLAFRGSGVQPNPKGAGEVGGVWR
jgi:hypothetical protein